MTEVTELREADADAAGTAAGGAFKLGRPVPVPLLFRRCDPAELPFAVGTDLEEAPGPIGQERAVEAVQFAIRMRNKGYNVYALVARASGRHSMVEPLLSHKADTGLTPPNWCSVSNCANPRRPP